MSAAKARAASACMPGITCWYTAIVKAGEAWPNRSDTTFTGCPCFNKSDAWVWRRSWNRMTGTPARLMDR